MNARKGSPSELAPMLAAMLNMTAFHREHEKFYSAAPREQTVVLQRAADLLDRVDFSPAAVRADLSDRHTSAHRLYSAAEMIDHAADLFSDFAGIVHDNERRWRVVRSRILEYANTLEHQSCRP